MDVKSFMIFLQEYELFSNLRNKEEVKNRVTQSIFNLWINKYVACDVQFVKNVLAFMLYAWNRCSFPH